MKVFLDLEPCTYRPLMTHLLPPESSREQAAFLFAKPVNGRDEVNFEVREMYLVDQAEFSAHYFDYIELSDEARMGLIKKAHDLEASIVELHSHPGPLPAAFSAADRIGLKETVAHMWWRLKGRPYLALVVAPSGYDALVWFDNPRVPRALDGLRVGKTILQPTHNSLGGWK